MNEFRTGLNAGCGAIAAVILCFVLCCGVTGAALWMAGQVGDHYRAQQAVSGDTAPGD